MLTDRDSVCAVTVETCDDGSKYYLVKSKEYDGFPEKKDAVRIWQYEASKFETYKEDGEDVVHTFGFFQMDVKGYVPPAMLNMACANNFFKYF